MQGPSPLPLQDIHLPPPPGWWPPAPGWWLLAALLLTAMGFAARWLKRRLRRRRTLRARQQIFRDALTAGSNASERLAAMSQLLRRAALLRMGPRVASLTGEDWLRFLDGDARDRPFSQGAGRLLHEGPFRAPPPSNGDAAGVDDAQATGLAEVEQLAWRRYSQLLEAGDA